MAEAEEPGKTAPTTPEPSSPYKIDWYQSDTQVVVSVFAKNIDPNSLKFELKETEIRLEATCRDGVKSEKTLNLEGRILPEKCTHRVAQTKVEIRLVKADGTRWRQLERQVATPVTTTVKASQSRDWDKVVKEIDEDPADGEAKLQELFQKIYSEGSDEVKKAMNKSFMESGGTELNTNWGAVSKAPVTIKPPDGMEWKKWDG